MRTPEGAPIPPSTLAELRRAMARLRFVSDQIAGIEAARERAREVRQRPRTARDGPAGLALPRLPEGERPGAPVPAEDREHQGRPQDDGRRAGAQAPDRAPAVRGHG